MLEMWQDWGSLEVLLQVCECVDGRPWQAVGYVPCTSSQSLRWKLSQDGAEAAGVQWNGPAVSGH